MRFVRHAWFLVLGAMASGRASAPRWFLVLGSLEFTLWRVRRVLVLKHREHGGHGGIVRGHWSVVGGRWGAKVPAVRCLLWPIFLPFILLPKSPACATLSGLAIALGTVTQGGAALTLEPRVALR